MLAAGAAVLLVAATDWRVGLDLSLGVLYIFPVILAATVLSRRQIVAFAMLCALLRLAFNPLHSPLAAVLGFSLAALAYTAAGFFISELVRNRQLAISHIDQIRRHQSLRREAEEQLRLLAESSPAAIMTVDSDGRVLAANRAAHDLLAFQGEHELIGQPIGSYLPVLADALRFAPDCDEFRTAAQCWGRRRSGDVFIAHTWFSTYPSAAGRRLAAIAVDSSEEVRDREEQNLRQLLHSNRILAGAVSHDIRNFCAAIGVVHSNLRRVKALDQNADFCALGDLVQGLGKIASVDLQASIKEALSGIDLRGVLEQLRIVIEPSWREIGGEVVCQVPETVPAVLADPTGLLQVLLNLAHNSRRAAQHRPRPKVRIETAVQVSRVLLRVTDNGTGVAEPGSLFQPFQPGASSAGIGLYVSRAILRSYGGDLRYQPRDHGACFVIELETAATTVSREG
jgi:PAS domain S-box-containing protein